MFNQAKKIPHFALKNFNFKKTAMKTISIFSIVFLVYIIINLVMYSLSGITICDSVETC